MICREPYLTSHRSPNYETHVTTEPRRVKKQIPISKMMTLTAGLLLLTAPSIWAQDLDPEREQTIARIAKLGGKFELDQQRPGKACDQG